MFTGSALGAAAFAVLGVVALLSFYTYFQLADRVLVGVHSGGVRLGNRTLEQATEAVAAAWQADSQSLTLADGRRRWRTSPAEFGLAVDAQATAQRALDVGHADGLFAELGILFDAVLTGYPVAPVVTLDTAQARAALEEWAATVDEAPQDATIRLEAGSVEAVPGVPGRALDVEATLGALAADPGRLLQDGTLPLIMSPVEPRISDVSGAVAEAEALLSRPLTVATYDPVSDEHMSFTAAPQEIAGWLAVEEGESGPRVTVEGEKLAGYVTGLGGALGEGRYIDAEAVGDDVLAALREGRTATLIVQHEPTTYTVVGGDTLTRIAWKVGIPYWRIAEANPGLNVDALTVGQQLTIPSKDDLLPLPVVPGKRIVLSIGEQHMWLYENGQQVRDFVISTGIQDSPTQPGIFQVQSHEVEAYASAWDLWMPHFIGIYEAWPGFMNGFHGLPTLSSGVTLWRDILGRPASYGCIILDLPDAEWLFSWAEAGVVVEIRE